jgi:hypothetical protein
MRIALITDNGEPGYAGELLQAWGVRNVCAYRPEALPSLTSDMVPAVILCTEAVDTEAILHYVRSGGILICFCPTGALAEAAGLRAVEERPLPALLRMTAYTPPGLAGEMLPIVGRAVRYEQNDEAAVLGYLASDDDPDHDSPGITSTAVGKGRIFTFAFDLPLCVQMLRQGDPARREHIPGENDCPRPAQLACPLPTNDAGWVPFADLLALLLVDLLAHALPLPLPLISQLPDEAPALLLFSGDEDNAPPEATQEEMDWLAANQARMDLYVIPELTPTTPEMLAEYRRHHDAGPHPDLRHLDGQPLSERLADLERQIWLFIARYGFQPLCLRNHCIVWPGYTEMAEVLERCGIRMDTNYTSGQYRAGRRFAPYAAFGAALPIRFCSESGKLFNVYQQPTHIMDDIWFAPDHDIYKHSFYSYRFAPAAFESIAARILDDMVQRFHTPLALCIHPGNWVRFSAEQGQALVRHAQQRGMPVWSITQWCRFWDRRDTWRINKLQWQNGVLSVHLSGAPEERLRLQLPVNWQDKKLQKILVDGIAAEWTQVMRYQKAVALVAMPTGAETMEVVAEYA